MEPRFGAVLFDEPDTLDGGWYCLAGEACEPHRFERCGDIPVGAAARGEGGYAYFTNMGGSLVNALSGWRVHFRGEGYLRARLHFLFEELGLPWRRRYASDEISSGKFIVEPARDSDREMAVRLMARIFSRVLRLGKVESAGAADVWGLWYVLRERADFPPPDVEPSAASGMGRVLRRATMEREIYGTTAGTALEGPGAPVLRFQRNRLWHGREVLSVPVPVNSAEWRYVRQSKLTVDWVMNQDRPIVAEARVVRQPPEYGSLVNIGGRSSRERQYFTQPELAWLAMMGFDIEVIGAYIGAGYESAGTALPAGHLADLSFSAGILAENLWKARSVFSRRGSRKRGDYSLSPAGLWLHAQDRIASFLFALRALRMVQAHSELFESELVGYGAGHARIRLPSPAISERAWAHIEWCCRALETPAYGAEIGTLGADRGSADGD